MTSDKELRQNVERELEWEPSVDERSIGVSVVDGVVTLTGEVTSYGEKWKAERAVERVIGVRGIANELTVKTPSTVTDADIAQSAVDALRAHVLVPDEDVQVRVEHGWVTLTGTVSWDYQRRAAEHAVRNLRGVKGVANTIAVQPRLEAKDIKRKIEESFERQAIFDAHRVTVDARGSEVTLRGSVHSWAERHEAEKAAWAAPGVSVVHNYITVDPLVAAA
jgi:osmotically-inducible protein OsmY